MLNNLYAWLLPVEMGWIDMPLMLMRARGDLDKYVEMVRASWPMWLQVYTAEHLKGE